MWRDSAKGGNWSWGSFIDNGYAFDFKCNSSRVSVAFDMLGFDPYRDQGASRSLGIGIRPKYLAYSDVS